MVKAGDRFGVMKFGSRMDVFLPADATIAVKVGDKVVGGRHRDRACCRMMRRTPRTHAARARGSGC